MKEQVLQAMREAGKPVSAGDVTKALGADRKEVDKAFAELKKEGAIVSPVRCKWEPAKYLHYGNPSSKIQKRRVLHPALRHGRRRWRL